MQKDPSLLLYKRWQRFVRESRVALPHLFFQPREGVMYAREFTETDLGRGGTLWQRQTALETVDLRRQGGLKNLNSDSCASPSSILTD